MNATNDRLITQPNAEMLGRGLEPTVSKQTILQGGCPANSANPPPQRIQLYQKSCFIFLIYLLGIFHPFL